MTAPAAHLRLVRVAASTVNPDPQSRRRRLAGGRPAYTNRVIGELDRPGLLLQADVRVLVLYHEAARRSGLRDFVA